MSGRNPEVDTYIANAAPFAQPILERIRELFHRASPEIEETIKWGAPSFDHQGIVGNMAAFKAHVNAGFWKGEELEELADRFTAVGKTGMRMLRLTSVDDLPPEDLMLRAIAQAVRLNQEGTKPAARPEKKKQQRTKVELPPVPDDLAAALAENDAARATFEGFSPSNKKEYILWLTEAKREATRTKRLAQAIEWMAGGKPKDWRYMKAWRS